MLSSTTSSRPVIVFYENIELLIKLYLHRFIIAQANEFIKINSIVYFCTIDDPTRLQQEFLNRYIPGTFAISSKDTRTLKQIKPTVVFVSSVLAAAKLALTSPFRSRQYQHILWYQGILPEESFLRRRNYLRKLVLIYIEQLALSWSDVVLLPSDSMREYLSAHNRLPEKKYLTVPNAIDNIPPIFAGSRELWNIGDDNTPTIGYCGGISAWQCFEEAAMLVANLQHLNPELRFLVLTYDPDKAQEILQRQKVSRFIIRTSAPEETYRFVQAFDLGLLLRRPHPINAVSFPLKYLDYISNGVPVCTTGAVDSIREDAENNHGLLIDVDRDESQRVIDHLAKCVKNRQVVREELRLHASQKWTWEKINKECRELYLEIVKNGEF